MCLPGVKCQSLRPALDNCRYDVKFSLYRRLRNIYCRIFFVSSGLLSAQPNVEAPLHEMNYSWKREGGKLELGRNASAFTSYDGSCVDKLNEN